MVKMWLTAAGLAFALVATVSAPVQGGRAGSACEVATSNVVDGDGVDERGRKAQDDIEAAIGRGKPKERIADQLRRGLIGMIAHPGTGAVTAVMMPEFGRADRIAVAGATFVTGCHSAKDLIEAEDVLIGRSWQMSSCS